jgi:hypothetical protein
MSTYTIARNNTSIDRGILHEMCSFTPCLHCGMAQRLSECKSVAELAVRAPNELPVVVVFMHCYM